VRDRDIAELALKVKKNPTERGTPFKATTLNLQRQIFIAFWNWLRTSEYRSEIDLQIVPGDLWTKVKETHKKREKLLLSFETEDNLAKEAERCCVACPSARIVAG
jgi:hypothetical protein